MMLLRKLRIRLQLQPSKSCKLPDLKILNRCLQLIVLRFAEEVQQVMNTRCLLLLLENIVPSLEVICMFVVASAMLLGDTSTASKFHAEVACSALGNITFGILVDTLITAGLAIGADLAAFDVVT